MIEATSQALTIFGISVPTVVWASISSAIIASGITFSGVLFTNWNSRKQLEATLEHETTQKDREREMSLRKDVYLKSAEAIYKGQVQLMNMCNLEIPIQELSDRLTIDSAIISKVQIVATNKTVQAITHFTTKLSASYLELCFNRHPLDQRKDQIEVLQNLINNSLKKNDKNILLMEQFYLKGDTDKKKWKVINDHFEFENNQRIKYESEQKTLQNEQSKEHLGFIRLCYQHHANLNQLIPPAIFAVRKELEFPIDKDAYMKLFNEAVNESQKMTNSFINKSENIQE